jgi:hypothetical protein
MPRKSSPRKFSPRKSNKTSRDNNQAPNKRPPGPGAAGKAGSASKTGSKPGPRHKQSRDPIETTPPTATKGPRRPRGNEAPNLADAAGSGPIGAMTRWARSQRRLSFIFIPPLQALDDRDLRDLLERARSYGRRAPIGITRQSLSNLQDSQRRILTRAPFTIAELPTQGLKTIARHTGGRIAPELIHGALAALVYGVPLVAADAPTFDAGRHLATMYAGFDNEREDLGRRFPDLLKESAGRIVETYSLAEKPILTMLDMSKARARDATLKGNLRRQVEMRRSWLERQLHKSHRNLQVKQDNGVIANLDLLPLILLRLEGPPFLELVEALTTPLGAMALGVCPFLTLPAAPNSKKGKAKDKPSPWDNSSRKSGRGRKQNQDDEAEELDEDFGDDFSEDSDEDPYGDQDQSDQDQSEAGLSEDREDHEDLNAIEEDQGS